MFFERHSLLDWLLSTPKPLHPILGTEISPNVIREIYAGAKEDNQIEPASPAVDSKIDLYH